MTEFIPNKIRELREKHNLSRDGLADQIKKTGLKVTQKTIGSWESGNTYPPADYLAVLAWIFNVSVAIFFVQKVQLNTALDNRTLHLSKAF